MSRVLVFSSSDDDGDDDGDGFSSESDVGAPVRVGGAGSSGARRVRTARVRAPDVSESESDEPRSAGVGGASVSEGSDATVVEGEAERRARVGARTIHAVGRARQDAFERSRDRRERAKATARRRIESLELELQVARDVEQRALVENLAIMDEIRSRLAARDDALFENAHAMRRARVEAETSARKATEALVMRAVVADAEAREAAEKARVEEEKRAREAAEAAKKKAELAEIEAKKKAEEDARAKAAEDEAKKKQAEADYVSGRVVGGEIPRVAAAAEALEQEKMLAETLAQARATVAEYQSHPSAKIERRKLTNAIVVHIQQIAATKEQINKKSRDILTLLVQLQEPQKTFALLSIAKKMLSQCDVQVAKLNRYAFALAEVAVRIACDVPRFGALLVALIHEVCVNTVPKYYPFVQGRYATDGEYYDLMGYVKPDDSTGAYETTDAYVDRMTGFMLFYAAFLQVDAPNHPHGMDAAWRWLARLLNRCPPNRHTAVALDSFLKIAGYRMHQQYRGQFIKVLELVHGEFIPKLDAKDNPDIRPVSSRMKTYLHEHSYAKPPEGREMPMTDTSTTTTC